MSKTVANLTRLELDEGEPIEGQEILRIIFAPEGPVVMLTDTAEAMLRGANGQDMREIIEDSIKAVLDRLLVH